VLDAEGRYQQVVRVLGGEHDDMAEVVQADAFGEVAVAIADPAQTST